MLLTDLRDALLSLNVPVHHFFGHKEKANQYIVWAEDGEAGSGHADNQKTNQVIMGTIDYFTKTEFDGNIQLIQEKLNSLYIAWRLNSIQHEDDTGFIHYEWVWEMIENG